MPEGPPLIVLSQPPYAGSGARAALDLALAYAVFSQTPRLLFAGRGVLQLRRDQNPAGAGRKSLRKVIDSLPLYDVEEVFVCADALERWAMVRSDIPAFATVVDGGAISALRGDAGHILSL